MKNEHANKELFQVFSPVRSKNDEIINNLIRSTLEQIENIDHIFFVVEEDAKALLEDKIKKNNLDKTKKYSILTSKNNTTKLTKMSMISNLIKEDKFVIVLDEDDQLLEISKMISLIMKQEEDIDLILTPLTFSYEGTVYNKNYQPENVTWEDNNTFPYYNNHNTFPIGKIFKEFFDNCYERIFQKHEDVFRSVFYIDRSKNTLTTEDAKHSIIKYNIINGHDHTSLRFDKKSISLWMNALAINIKNSNLKLSKDKPLYKSQRNALIRILRTILIVHDMGMLEKESLIASQELSKRLGLEFEKKSLFTTDGLEEFYQNVINGKRIKMH